jgi:hypothetical protein
VYLTADTAYKVLFHWSLKEKYDSIILWSNKNIIVSRFVSENNEKEIVKGLELVEDKNWWYKNKKNGNNSIMAGWNM